MGKYLGPVCRLCRRERVKLFLKGDKCSTAKCPLSKRKKAPGMGSSKKGKLSYYGMQLREKQKLKRFYYLSEAQFHKYYELATKARGNTGEVLLQILERRLDNIIYRAGFTTSRKQARQLVSHKFFTVNGINVNIPSILIKKGDVIKIKENRINSSIIQENLNREISLPNWLEKIDAHTVKVIDLPLRSDIQDIQVKEQMIIELYSK
ncbi:MAG TPA: 30S ribosomal protein S4 [Spirochaetota bacterium]|nr:30S ribosomal protein S4 [Spirochaetota bacterium]HOM37939.1 30S ribosomal protein S4 [Spirochaetota bacterium]HPQ48743.1 30S ribosomal protein S4 [Spirochaetota bacterium]